MSLTHTIEYVTAYFQRHGIDTPIWFGDREHTKQINQGPGRANRVVFAAGDDAGNLGTYGPAEQFPPSHKRLPKPPRTLWTLKLNVRIYIWAYDGDAPRDELRQFVACSELHDWTIDAIHHIHSGFYKMIQTKRVGNVIEQKFGYEMMSLVSIDYPVLERPKLHSDTSLRHNGDALLQKAPEANGE